MFCCTRGILCLHLQGLFLYCIKYIISLGDVCVLHKNTRSFLVLFALHRPAVLSPSYCCPSSSSTVLVWCSWQTLASEQGTGSNSSPLLFPPAHLVRVAFVTAAFREALRKCRMLWCMCRLGTGTQASNTTAQLPSPTLRFKPKAAAFLLQCQLFLPNATKRT